MISEKEALMRTRIDAKPSVAQVMGHAIHPILVAFPITFYTIATASFVTYAVNGNVFWFRAAFYACVAGVVAAVLAAIPGMADYFGSIPSKDPAKKVAKTHAGLNVLALFCFAAIVAMMWTNVTPDAIYTESVTAPLWLSIIGLAATLAAGYLGGELVQKHHVSIEPTALATRPVSSQVVTTTPL